MAIWTSLSNHSLWPFLIQNPLIPARTERCTSTTLLSASACTHTYTHTSMSIHRIWGSAVLVFFFFFFLRNEKENNNRTFHGGPWTETRMGVRMCKVYCSCKVKQGCEVYLTWKVRGLWLVYLATDIGSQEKWVVRKTRKWASWVEATAESHADTNTLRAGEGHRVIKGAAVRRQNKSHSWCSCEVLKMVQMRFFRLPRWGQSLYPLGHHSTNYYICGPTYTK